MRRTVLLIIAQLLLTATLYGQVKAIASLDSLNYPIGAEIALHVTVQHPHNVSINWAQLKIPKGKFEKLGQSKIDTPSRSSLLTERRTINLTTFDTGILHIPSLAFHYQLPGKKPDSAVTNLLLIQVSSLAIDTTKGFKGIKPPMSVAFTSQNTLWIYLAAGCTLLAIAVILLLVTRRKPKRKNAEDLKTLSRLTLEKLEKLEKEKVWEKEGTDAYYVKLTHILREYINGVFDINALKNTSGEIVTYLNQKITNPEILRRLSADLALADLVKFARASPTGDESHTAVKSARHFVMETEPKKK